MTQVEILDAARGRDGGYKVDASRGERIGRVSSEWFSRPADERYLSLSDLFAAVRGRTERSRTRTIESAAIRVEASRDDAERLSLAAAGFRQSGRHDALELRPARKPRRRAGGISSPAPGAARRNQSAIWLNLASRRAGEDARDRKRPGRTARGDRSRLWPDL